VTSADLISKRTRNAFREALVDWTLAEITTEFDNEGLSPDLEYDPHVGGQRRSLVEQLYHRIDFADRRHAARLLGVYQTVVSRARGNNPELANSLIDHLNRDGVDSSGAAYIPSQRSHSPLRPLSAVAVALTADQLLTQIERINASIDTDPALAIGTAKELVETTCKTILADTDGDLAKLDLGELVKAAAKQLKLVPDGVPNEAKGAEAIRRTLRSLAATVAGLGEMRNFYGSGHGQDGRAKGLTPRHARLAVGAACTVAMFLFETHDARRA
jgi:Abortive infection C-terminus